MDERELLRKLNERYGSTFAPEGELSLRDERLFLYTGSQTKLTTLWAGLHIANTDLSLTIEGAQIFGKTATRNTVDVTGEQAEAYYLGEDLSGFDGAGYVILKTRERPIGCGNIKSGRIVNILHESRKTSI